MAKFDQAIGYILDNEQEGPTVDQGGVTKWGIAQKFHTDVDVPNLTRAGAIELYRIEYWNPMFDGISDERAATKIFDFYVNMVPSSAVKVVQRSVRLTDDGKWGPKTEQAVNAVQDRQKFYDELTAQLCKHYCDDVLAKPEEANDLLGWLRRAVKWPTEN